MDRNLAECFFPLNVEIESESEDEIDDSKEIQIEEALKLYQNALKLHSQGPASYYEAEVAYNELFRSEIFTYPESLSEAQRIEQYDGEEDSEDELDDGLATTLPALTIGTDGAPSSLPQILYLAYKNHGQFLLDRLKYDLSCLEQEIRSKSLQHSPKNISKAASSSLRLFVEALDRDDTDLELWRQTSRIGGFLGSGRIARYSLEAVLDTDGEAEPLGLEECFATEQLKPLLASLDDQLSESQIPAAASNQKTLINALRKYIDPCPYLPIRMPTPLVESNVSARQQIIKVPLRTWASCGRAILFQLSQEAQGIIDPDAGASYLFSLSPRESAKRPTSAPKMTTNGDTLSDLMPLPAAATHHPLNSVSQYLESSDKGRIPHGPLKPVPLFPAETYMQGSEQALESPTKIVNLEDSGIGLPKDGESLDSHGGNVHDTAQGARPVSLPTRKRSSEAAELPDSTDVVRSKSKRIKARGSIDPDSLKDSTAEDWSRWYEQQLQIYYHADDMIFKGVRDFLSKLGSSNVSDLQSLRAIVSKQYSSGMKDKNKRLLEPTDVALQDLQDALDSWDWGRSKAFTNGHDSKDLAGGINDAQSPSFTAFLEHTRKDVRKSSQLPMLSDDEGLDQFAGRVADGWNSVNQLSFQWISQLLGHFELSGQGIQPVEDIKSSYEAFLWPETLKETVVQVLVGQDEFLYKQLETVVEVLGQTTKTGDLDHDWSQKRCMQVMQVIFELHLDVYGLITGPTSQVDIDTRLQQRDRLGRWFAFSSKLLNQWSQPGYDADGAAHMKGWDLSDRLCIRFLWASVVCNSLVEPAARENTILCYRDLIQVLGALERDVLKKKVIIVLPNNAIMPEISIETAEREISRLTTMDFFMSVFSSENNDPLTIIESLEPLLDSSVNYQSSADCTVSSPIIPTDTDGATEPSGPGVESSYNLSKRNSDPKLLEALHFLEQGPLALRLFLWQKLRDAYRSIGYPPQVLSCDLRILALIVNHLSSPSFIESPDESRRDGLLRWLHRIDDHMTRILGTAISKTEAFECIDCEHVRTALESLAALQKILHVFASWEDTIRVGKTPQPVPVGSAATKGLARSTDKFRDMIVKTWTFQYLLQKEAMKQYAELFKAPDEDLIERLEHMHQALGLRCYCHLANKSFLKLMKTELERCRDAEHWETDMAQLVFDLYGVKISSNAMEMQEHFCPSEELDRSTALEILDLVMIQTNRKDVKDLLRSDLKSTVERMQQVIRIPKLLGSTSRTFNNRLANSYLKSPVNPYDLYRSLRGIGGLPGVIVHDEGSDVAAKGWYFLLGNISLTKFTSQKRTAAGSIEDLEVARAFFRHDLEFNTDRWESWYRLAKVFDTMIDEDATWSADKLDNHMDDLAVSQRKAIHCYSMALAVATRCAVANFEETDKIADLCADYGSRLYASSREPFSMKAFDLDDFKRHYNSRTNGMYQGVPFQTLQLYATWKLASTLLRRATIQKPHNWVISFKLGKVLWKMHNCGDDVRGAVKRITYQPAVDAFVRAVEACPEKRDARHPEKDPILEPHYKLVSVVHKLVHSNRISTKDGCRILKATPYSRKAPGVTEDEDWGGYMLQVLRALRSADKANWHHRMVARAAHTIYDNDPTDPRAILGAKYEFNQQIFTKTMAIQVWKPDNERPGRHFVYTSRYVRFFTRLLYQLNDKTNLEALARRIRKKTGDFVNHSGVWEEVCRAYLQLLRHQPNCIVPEGYSELVFQGMHPDTYQSRAIRLETWMHAQATSPPIVDILREAIELKKLNNNLFKSNLFEDLIRDIYAHLYDSVMPNLVAQDAVEENRVRMSVDTILTNPTPSVETPSLDLSAAQAEQQKSRTKWLTQRELVRRAEAIAAKPAPTIPAKVLKPLAPALVSPKEQSGKPGSTPALAVVIDLDKDGTSSVPGSVHDSADDESELSEVDEDVVEIVESRLTDATAERPPLFPNLRGAKTPDIGDGDDTMGGVTGDETVDEGENRDQDEDEEVLEPQGSQIGVPQGNW